MQLLGVMVCNLMVFERVCSAFTFVRWHGKTKGRGQFSQFLIRTRTGQPPFIPNMLV